MNKPNLFNFATSELSQDAFIAWLLTWANKEYAEIDKNLHDCAVDFVRKLLNKDDYVVEIVNVTTQWKHTDISAEVNGEYFLLIEDKTATKEHAGNLKYVEMAKKHYEKTNFKVIPVYFKMEEQGNYAALKAVGYDIFTREQMLPILENYYSIITEVNKNDILLDYFFHLKALDKKINGFKTLPLNEWYWNSWKGFFFAIQKEVNSWSDWHYVHNQSGGFLGFWWHFKHQEHSGSKYEIYLQLEHPARKEIENKLVFKISTTDIQLRRKIRDFYRAKLLDTAKEQNIKINKFGSLGESMGVAKLSGDFRVPAPNGLIDLPATIENLKKMEQLLNSVVEKL
ncbi:MAG: hypothetical protein WBI40_06610 [Methylococcaceae bacterium]